VAKIFSITVELFASYSAMVFRSIVGFGDRSAVPLTEAKVLDAFTSFLTMMMSSSTYDE
jgi:hypothetical protein